MSKLFVDDIVEKTSGHGVSIPGHVVQHVFAQKTSTGTGLTTTSTSMVSTGHSVTITPKFSNSIIIGWLTYNYWFSGGSTSDYSHATIYRGSTNLASLASSVASTPANNTVQMQLNPSRNPMAGYNSTFMFDFKDAPATTSATTYTLYSKTSSGSTMYVNWDGQLATMSVMEIAQ